jgi:HEAT repeat protein
MDAADSTRFAAAKVLLERQVDYLIAHYGQPNNAHLIRRLIEAKVAADDEAIIPLLLGLFSKVRGEERVDFEVYLLSFGSRVEKDLIGLLSHGDTQLVMRTLDALGKLKSVAAVDAIAPLLGHPDAWIRMGAAHALGDIGARRSVLLLVNTLQDSLHSVVNAALVALGRLRAAEAYAPIRTLIDSDNHHIRKHAAMALGELGDARALAAVRALAADDEDPGVRFMASKALEKLEAGQ